MANPSRRSQRTSEPEWHRKVRKAKNLLVEVEMANEAPAIMCHIEAAPPWKHVFRRWRVFGVRDSGATILRMTSASKDSHCFRIRMGITGLS